MSRFAPLVESHNEQSSFLKKMRSTYFVCLTIILAPLYALTRFSLLVPTNLLEILVLVSVVLSLIELRKKKLRLNFLKTKFDLYILFFLIASLLATIFSLDQIGGLGILKAYFIETVLFYYTLVYQIRVHKNYYFIVYSLLISGVWLAVLGITQYLTGWFNIAPHELLKGRISGVYNSANALSLYLSPIALLSFGVFLTKSDKSLKIVGSKWLYLAIFCLMSAALALTQSRGGIVAFFFGFIILCYAYFSAWYKSLRTVWYLIPTIFFVCIIFFFTQLNSAYQSPEKLANIRLQGDTVGIRYLLWMGTSRLLMDNPIFGTGLNGFRVLFPDYRPHLLEESYQYPHNLILNFWVETGILGLLAFLTLLIMAYLVIIKDILRVNNNLVGIFAVAALSYWLIHGMVDVPFFKNDLSLEFFVVLSLVAGWKILDESNTKGQEKG